MTILRDLRTAYGEEDYHRRKPFFNISKGVELFNCTDRFITSRLYRSTMPRGRAYLKLIKLEDRALYLKLDYKIMQYLLNT